MSKAHAAASEGQCAPRRAAPSKHSPIGGGAYYEKRKA